MIQISIENNFPSWRTAARKLLQAEIAPDDVLWTDGAENSLFTNDLVENPCPQIHKVTPEFIKLAEAAACFDDSEKWFRLYSLLFRLTFENRDLLHIESDDDVRKLRLMEKAVARDVHKFHAFVRFRRIEIADREIFVAWHEPQHLTVKRAAPFFVRRFGAMRFSIFTAKNCAHWDLKHLTFSAGVQNSNVSADETEDFWLTYYEAIFNPFRLKIKAMKAELPVRHWGTLPEAVLIPKLIRRAEFLNKKYQK